MKLIVYKASIQIIKEYFIVTYICNFNLVIGKRGSFFIFMIVNYRAWARERM